MIETIINYSFFRNAVFGIVLASIICGIIGTVIVEKKLVMMSGGISHTAFGGVGMGYFLGIEPIIGALIFAVIASFAIAKINRKFGTNADSLIGMFWALGMSLGILFISFTPGYPPDMTSYLFGDILTISKFDLVMMMILVIVIITFTVALFNYFKAYLFDDEFSYVIGVNVNFIEYLMYFLIACTIVVLIRVVGIMLVIAMLTVPPAIAKQFTYNLKNMMITSSVFGIIFGLIGLYISYKYNIASGASIIIVSVISYLLISIIKKIVGKFLSNREIEKEFNGSKNSNAEY
ncbi:metal ABC transporter permease [Clostridium sediminicola]|uniref:metal ABC transporter permease n=1 Tax=Clostridium sediminicola TaxID=3114879 RepID=UPI0031F24728